LGPASAHAPEFPLAAGALVPLRLKAEATGSGDFSPMWCGQAARLGRDLPARELTKSWPRRRRTNCGGLVQPDGLSRCPAGGGGRTRCAWSTDSRRVLRCKCTEPDAFWMERVRARIPRDRGAGRSSSSVVRRRSQQTLMPSPGLAVVFGSNTHSPGAPSHVPPQCPGLADSCSCWR